MTGIVNSVQKLFKADPELASQAKATLLRKQSDLTRVELRRVESLKGELGVAEKALEELSADLPRQVKEARDRAWREFILNVGAVPLPLPQLLQVLASDWLLGHLAEVEQSIKDLTITARRQQLAALEEKHRDLLAELACYA
jgi:hypothetical protein